MHSSWSCKYILRDWVVESCAAHLIVAAARPWPRLWVNLDIIASSWGATAPFPTACSHLPTGSLSSAQHWWGRGRSDGSLRSPGRGANRLTVASSINCLQGIQKCPGLKWKCGSQQRAPPKKDYMNTAWPENWGEDGYPILRVLGLRPHTAFNKWCCFLIFNKGLTLCVFLPCYFEDYLSEWLYSDSEM